MNTLYVVTGRQKKQDKNYNIRNMQQQSRVDVTDFVAENCEQAVTFEHLQSAATNPVC
jgi:hypothetical protein